MGSLYGNVINPPKSFQSIMTDGSNESITTENSNETLCVIGDGLNIMTYSAKDESNDCYNLIVTHTINGDPTELANRSIDLSQDEEPVSGGSEDLPITLSSISQLSVDPKGHITDIVVTNHDLELVGKIYKPIDEDYNNQDISVVDGIRGNEVFNDYSGNKALNYFAHAEGNTTLAAGDSSHTEGSNTTVYADYGHAEGDSSMVDVDAIAGHAEGFSSITRGSYGHAEGECTEANGEGSHSEGCYSIAEGYGSHAEGSSQARGEIAHSEGSNTLAIGTNSHSEGQDTIAFGNTSYSGGKNTKSLGLNSRASGVDSIAIGSNSIALGSGGASVGNYSIAISTASAKELIGRVNYETFIENTDRNYASNLDEWNLNLIPNAYYLLRFKQTNIYNIEYDLIVQYMLTTNKLMLRPISYFQNFNTIKNSQKAFTEVEIYKIPTQALGFNSLAMGRGIMTTGAKSIAIGNYNVIDSNRLFQIGIGDSEQARNDLIYTVYNLEKGRYETNFTGIIKAQDYYIGEVSLKDQIENLTNTQQNLISQTNQNTEDIQDNKNQINANTGAIDINARNIAVNTSIISSHTNSIQEQTKNINTLNAMLNEHATSIAHNTQEVNTLNSIRERINTAENNIADNSNKIQQNLIDIRKNSSEITAVDNKVDETKTSLLNSLGVTISYGKDQITRQDLLVFKQGGQEIKTIEIPYNTVVNNAYVITEEENDITHTYACFEVQTMDGSIKVLKIDLSSIVMAESLFSQQGEVTLSKNYEDSNKISGTISAQAITGEKLKQTNSSGLDGAVSEQHINNNSVSTNKIQNSAITSAKIANKAIKANHLSTVTDEAGAAVGTDQIAIGAITNDKMSAGSIATSNLIPGSVTTEKIADEAITAGKLAKLSITSAHIQKSGIEDISIKNLNGAKIQTATITNTQLSDNCINTNQIINNSITSEKILANNINGGHIANLSITSAHIQPLQIVGKDKTGHIAEKTITNYNIADKTIISEKIADDAIITSKIKDANITTSKIVDKGVTTQKIADGAIISSKIADGIITSVKIESDAITTEKIQADAVTTDKIADSAITTEKLANNSIDNDNIKNGTITKDKLNVALTTEINNKMEKTNPVGTGSFSFNKPTSSTIGVNSILLSTGSASNASGENSVAIGFSVEATGKCAQAYGYDTVASGYNSHAEGSKTMAKGANSHTEGSETETIGSGAHAEGMKTLARGTASHSEGIGTVAYGPYQHVQGRNNIEDRNHKYAHIVGNGILEEKDADGNIMVEKTYSNAHTLDWEGNAWFAGGVNAINVEVDKVILRSSSPNSNKKFALTIDDDGVLSIEEV